MILNMKGPGRAFMNVVIDWAGDVSNALEQIAGAYLTERNSVGEVAFPNDDTWWAGDDSPALSRTIRWADGRDATLLWKLPSPGP